jgi:hypothetical protein
VFPKEIKTEPWACGAMDFSMVIGRIWPGWRLSCRLIGGLCGMGAEAARMEFMKMQNTGSK